MINKKTQNFSMNEIFLILSYLICWFSISTSIYDVFYIVEKKNINLIQIINFLRQFLNLIIFPILIIFFFKKFKSIEFKNELLFIFAFFYLLFQIPGLLFTDNSLTNLVYIISSLNILFVFILANIFFDKKKYLIFFYITLFILLLITLLNYKAYVNFIIKEDPSVLYTYFFSPETFLEKDSPRSTGSSRSLLMIMIISYLIFDKFFKNNNKSKLMIYILISTLVILFQSRTIIVLLIIFVLLNFIYENDYSLKGVVKYLIIYFILPLLLIYTILASKQVLHDTKFYKYGMNPIELSDDLKRPIDPKTFSSGRFDDWKDILSKINKSAFYGYGSQGDRFLINQTASNGLLYALSSSGILGILPFILFSILSLWITLKIFFQNLSLKIPINFYSSITVILLLLRSLLESSYAVFSVDFIILYTFINYLNKFSYKNNDRN